MVFNKKTGKPRGYAFVEYEHERDMHCKFHYLLNVISCATPKSFLGLVFPIFEFKNYYIFSKS